MPSRPTSRIEALDGLRGLIMAFMALDHASMFVAHQHFGEFWGLPLPDYGDPFSLFTRVVSHLCAPGFFFLMGVGMHFFASSRRGLGWTRSRVLRQFALRGTVLILVEMLIVNPAWMLGSLEQILSGGIVTPPSPGGGGAVLLSFGVLSALGAAMAVGGLLVLLPPLVSAVLGLGVIAVCQVLLPSADSVAMLHSPLARVLLVAGQTHALLVYYPLAPWLGVCALGIGYGGALQAAPQRALRLALPAGIAALVLFVVVRGAEGFGTYHAAPGNDWMAFLSVTKYPPSAAFLLLSLGANAILLYGVSRMVPALHGWARPLRVYGRTALFFYVVHLYLYALLGLAYPGSTTLIGMYPVWLLGLALLYPACQEYDRFKSSRDANSLWRLF